jgi:SAM-dependent methyltransferase
MKKIISNKLGVTLDLNFSRTNILNVDTNKKYDLIYMKDVFHHLEPRDCIVEKLAKLLNPNGYIVIVEPNAYNFLIQLQMFKIRGFKTKIHKIDSSTGEKYVYGNERLISIRSLNYLFKNQGFECQNRFIRLIPTSILRISFFRFLSKYECKKYYPLLKLFYIHLIFIGKKI